MPAVRCRYAGTGRRPEPEGAVDVHPRRVRVRDLDALRERVARAGVQVAGLEQHDRRLVGSLGERAAQCVGDDATLRRRPRPARPPAGRGSAARGRPTCVVPARPAPAAAGSRRARGRAPSPAFISNVSRPAASPVKFAIVAPVAKPTRSRRAVPAARGTRRRRPPRPPTTAGVTLRSTVFWSQALDQPVGGQRGRLGAADDEAEEAAGRHGGEARARTRWRAGRRRPRRGSVRRGAHGRARRRWHRRRPAATPAGRPGWPASGARARARGRAPGRGRGAGVGGSSRHALESLPLAFPAPSPRLPRSSLIRVSTVNEFGQPVGDPVDWTPGTSAGPRRADRPHLPPRAAGRAARRRPVRRPVRRLAAEHLDLHADRPVRRPATTFAAARGQAARHPRDGPAGDPAARRHPGRDRDVPAHRPRQRHGRGRLHQLLARRSSGRPPRPRRCT